MTRARAVAIGVGLLAALAGAWFVLAIVQNDALVNASHIAGEPHPSARAARRAEALLRTAGTLNPDRRVAITRAQLILARGDAGRARSILRGVVAGEPENLNAWIGLVRASANDPGERRTAFAHALALTHTALPR